RGGRCSAPVRDRVAIVGVGETEYRPWGGITDRSEFQLACEAILAASADAGLSPHELDGFASYANDRNDAPRLAAALGCAELRFSGMVWDGGGGGVCAAVAHAAHAIHAGARSRSRSMPPRASSPTPSASTTAASRPTGRAR